MARASELETGVAQDRVSIRIPQHRPIPVKTIRSIPSSSARAIWPYCQPDFLHLVNLSKVFLLCSTTALFGKTKLIRALLLHPPTPKSNRGHAEPRRVVPAIVKNGTDVTAFCPEAIGDGRIRELAAKVCVRVDPELSAGGADGPTARATIGLKDGRVVEGEAGIVRGDYGNRAPREELLDKTHFLNDGVLGRERDQAVVRTVDRLEHLTDVRELTKLLAPEEGDCR